MTKQPSHVSDEGFASDPLDYRPTTQGKDNLDKVMESWRLDRTDLYDPFTQSALDDEYQCEKWNYDQNTKLYKRLNQNFHGRVQLSQFEEQVQSWKQKPSHNTTNYRHFLFGTRSILTIPGGALSITRIIRGLLFSSYWCSTPRRLPGMFEVGLVCPGQYGRDRKGENCTGACSRSQAR